MKGHLCYIFGVWEETQIGSGMVLKITSKAVQVVKITYVASTHIHR